MAYNDSYNRCDSYERKILVHPIAVGRTAVIFDFENFRRNSARGSGSRPRNVYARTQKFHTARYLGSGVESPRTHSPEVIGKYQSYFIRTVNRDFIFRYARCDVKSNVNSPLFVDERVRVEFTHMWFNCARSVLKTHAFLISRKRLWRENGLVARIVNNVKYSHLKLNNCITYILIFCFILLYFFSSKPRKALYLPPILLDTIVITLGDFCGARLTRTTSTVCINVRDSGNIKRCLQQYFSGILRVLLFSFSFSETERSNG